MKTAEVLMKTRAAAAKLQDAIDKKMALPKLADLLDEIRNQFFDLCYIIDEKGVEDGEGDVMADSINDTTYIMEDLLEEIDEKLIGKDEAYEEIEEIIAALHELAES